MDEIDSNQVFQIVIFLKLFLKKKSWGGQDNSFIS